MSTIAVTDVVVSLDAYLTRSKAGNSKTTGDVYTFPITQNYIKVVNNGDYDLVLNAGKYTNTIIHPSDTFAAFSDFDSFEIYSVGGVSAFVLTTKELETTPVDTISTLWRYMAERDKAGTGDIVANASNLTSSAGTINTAITGDDKKSETEFTITLKNTAGNTTHEWFSGTMPVSVAKTSTAGIVAIEDGADHVTFVDGVGKIKVVMTGTWKSGDVVTLKVLANDVMGFAVAEKSITDTLGA